MKFQFTSAFTLLLLNASASSFGANSPKKIHQGSSFRSTGIAFVSGGSVTSNNSFASTNTKLKSSGSSDATCINASISSENLELLSERGKNAILSLIEHDVDGDQAHVYGDWPDAGAEDEGKKLLADQVCLSNIYSLSCC